MNSGRISQNPKQSGIHARWRWRSRRLGLRQVHSQLRGYGLLVGDEPRCRYHGECINLSNRFNDGYGNICPRNCFKGGQETNCRLNHLIYQLALDGKRVSLWFCPTTEHKAAEKEMLSGTKPAWNR